MVDWTPAALGLARLVARARRGDRAAFGTLYDRLHPTVWGYVSRRVPNRQDAEDLVSRVFARLLEHLDRYDPHKSNVRTWALAIARNLVIDHFRTSKAIVGLHEVGAATELVTPDREVEGRAQVRRLRALMADYPPEIQDMFALRFGEGLRYREIATVLGLSEDAVKQRFSRTVRELKRRLEETPAEGKAERYAT